MSLEDGFSRTRRLIGSQAVDRLFNSKVLVFGVGGVGGHMVEALARSGVGEITLVDHDRVSKSNLNRQLVATIDTIGELKVEAMKNRIAVVNPQCKVTTMPMFFLPENSEDFDFLAYDYIADAIDTVAAKLAIVEKAKEQGVPLISAMGAGNKLDPSRFQVADIKQTSVCPLCRVMRRELRKRGIEHAQVVFSTEEPIKPVMEDGDERPAPGSIGFVPAAAGLVMAGAIIRQLAAGDAKEGIPC